MIRGWSCFQHDYQNIIDNYVNKDLFFSINGYSPIVDKLFNEYLIKYNIKLRNTKNAVS